MYMPPVVARPGAVGRGDCLAEFGQIGDVGAWFMGGTAPLNLVPGANNLDDCASACRAVVECEYITFDYNATNTKKCMMKLNTVQDQAHAAIG